MSLRRRAGLPAVALALAAALAGCDSQRMSLDLAAGGYGLGFGNSAELHGIRFNAVDRDVREVNGLNVTFWDPGRNDEFTQRGIAISLARTYARRMTGLAVGAVAGGLDADGINLGLLGVSSAGTLRGINAGSFLTWGGAGLYGLNVGLLVAGGADIGGITLAPLTIHPQPVTDVLTPHEGTLFGITACGLLLDYTNVKGIAAAGILRARRESGLMAAWWMNDARDEMLGLALAPFNFTRRLKGVQIGLLNWVESHPHPFKLLPLLNVGFGSAADPPESSGGGA